METLKITSNELAQMEELGRGACSTVYKYGTDLVIKMLNEKGIEMHNEKEFSNLIGIKNSTCVFPKSKVEMNGKFQGYTMDYVQGEELQNIIKQLDFPTLISAIQKAENDLQQLSKEKVVFQDLNQGGIMWDKERNCIKIIDTDFFEKNESISEEQCYSANIASFNSIIEMELGIINGQGTKLSEYLQSNPEFSQLYTKYMIYSLNGRNMSVTELINKAVEIFERDFGTKIGSIEEMQELIGERTETKESDIAEEVPIFEPPKEEQNKLGIKQKIANFLANKSLLRKIPIIDKFIIREQRLLPEKIVQEQKKDNRTEHSKFVDEVSENGKLRNLLLGQPIKNVEMKTAEQRNGELHTIADQTKIEQMRRKMDGKSMDDDL